MAAYCCISKYLEKHHPDWYNIIDQTCIQVDNFPLVVIPPKKELESLLTLAKKSKRSVDELKKLEDTVRAHCIHAKIHDSAYNPNEFHNNGLGHKTRVTLPKGDSLEIHSGEKLDNVAKCELADFKAGYSSRGDGTKFKNMAVAIIKTGSISITGLRSTDPNPEVTPFYGAGYPEFQSSDTGKLDKFEKMLRTLKTNIEQGNHKNPFVSAIAGLMKYLMENKNKDADHTRAYQLVVSLSTYDALGMYIVLLQPYGQHQFLNDKFTSQIWDGAELATDNEGDFCNLFQQFSSECDCIDHAKAAQLVSEARRETSSGRTASLKLVELYKEYIPKIFGDDYLEAPQKLWADECLFRLHKCFEQNCESPKERLLKALACMVDYASHHPGNDYQAESLYWDSEYWMENAAKESINGNAGPGAFGASDFFLKHKLVESTKSKRYVGGCINPMSTRARSYCLINGGSLFGSNP